MSERQLQLTRLLLIFLVKKHSNTGPSRVRRARTTFYPTCFISQKGNPLSGKEKKRERERKRKAHFPFSQKTLYSLALFFNLSYVRRCSFILPILFDQTDRGRAVVCCFPFLIYFIWFPCPAELALSWGHQLQLEKVKVKMCISTLCVFHSFPRAQFRVRPKFYDLADGRTPACHTLSLSLSYFFSYIFFYIFNTYSFIFVFFSFPFILRGWKTLRFLLWGRKNFLSLLFFLFSTASATVARGVFALARRMSKEKKQSKDTTEVLVEGKVNK